MRRWRQVILLAALALWFPSSGRAESLGSLDDLLKKASQLARLVVDDEQVGLLFA